MGKDNRTIILLSHKRSGTTALFKVFKKHSQVGVCHKNQEIDIWEPNFWNLASKGLNGDKQPFIDRFTKSHPFLNIPDKFTAESVFNMWDQILKELGPIVFDKSPQYLGNHDAVNLMLEYKKRGNDVRLLSIIRSPLDTISSQYEVLGYGAYQNANDKEEMFLKFPHLLEDTPEKREENYLKKHLHLEKLITRGIDIPTFRYEDIAAAPSCYFPMIFRHCGLINEEVYSHIRPTNIGRHLISKDPAITNWKPSVDIQHIAKKYGYLYTPPKCKVITKMNRFFNLIRPPRILL